jgi:ribonucleoside-diphosphate reductase alpha chain
MLGVSGGIEPIYANYYERRTESLYGKNVSYKVYTKIVETYMKEHQLKESSALPEYFVTAMNLDYHQRIRMQTGRNFKLKYRGQIRVKSPRI